MLVLSRKLGEEVCIGDEITVKVLAVRGKRVKLGFHCPPRVPIHRQEVVVTLAADDLQPDREMACAEHL